MKLSKFNISQPYQESILVYNTYSTSIVELEIELYNAIFERQEFSSHPEVEQLIEMGFIVEDSLNELEEQKHLRDTVVSTSGDIISNIIVAPTLQCNAHCYYCFEKGYRKGIMNTETALAVVKFLKEHWDGKQIGITWFGGEPLLAADIIEVMIDQLNKEGIPFASKITTNGSLLDGEMIQRIQKNGMWIKSKLQLMH